MISGYLNFLEKEMKENFPLLLEDKNGHDLKHFYRVVNHSIKALREEDLKNLPNSTKENIILASFLHDIDDQKFHQTENFFNARSLLIKLGKNNREISNERIEDIIEMISLVSCSKNGDNEVPAYHMIIPRLCDRLDAIGYIGLIRCYEYTISVNRPFHVEKTIVVKNMDDFHKFKDRYQNYLLGNKSESMIDHFYDRLLHIIFPCNNNYILEEAEKEKNILKEFIIKYWFNFEHEKPTKMKVLNIIKEFNTI